MVEDVRLDTTFTIVALAVGLVLPLLLIEQFHGQHFRQARIPSEGSRSVTGVMVVEKNTRIFQGDSLKCERMDSTFP